MKHTRPGPLVALGVIGTVLGFLSQLALAAAGLPKVRPEYSFAITLAAIAVLIVVLAVPVYRATHGPVRRRIDAFYAMRVVVLAKASSLTGALLSGVGLGFTIDLLIRSNSTTADFVLRILASFGAAILLLVAGLVAEFLCRVPPQNDEDHADHDPAHAQP
ncbi:DUF3180 domain-containing protein [Lysinimonas soli]|uniref:DUF3180 domain-containing protein n=1 Tax=Lysinimonas soli TaxID=1074233 RepID=A0ABW0NQ07_9MICO